MSVNISTAYASPSSSMSPVSAHTMETPPPPKGIPTSHSLPLSSEILLGNARDLQRELELHTATLSLYLKPQYQENLAGIFICYNSKLKEFEKKAEAIFHKLISLDAHREQASTIKELVKEFRLNMCKVAITQQMQELHDQFASHPIITNPETLSHKELTSERNRIIHIAAQITNNAVKSFGEELFNNNEQTKKTVALINSIQIAATAQIHQINAVTPPQLLDADDEKSSSPIPGKYHLYIQHR